MKRIALLTALTLAATVESGSGQTWKRDLADTFAGCYVLNSSGSDNKLANFEYNANEVRFEVCASSSAGCGRHVQFRKKGMTSSVNMTRHGQNISSVNFTFDCGPRQCIQDQSFTRRDFSIACPYPSIRAKLKAIVEAIEFAIADGGSVDIPQVVRDLAR